MIKEGCAASPGSAALPPIRNAMTNMIGFGLREVGDNCPSG